MALWKIETETLGMTCPILTTPGRTFQCDGAKCMAWEWKVIPDPHYKPISHSGIVRCPPMIRSDVYGRCALIK